MFEWEGIGGKENQRGIGRKKRSYIDEKEMEGMGNIILSMVPSALAIEAISCTHNIFIWAFEVVGN